MIIGGDLVIVFIQEIQQLRPSDTVEGDCVGMVSLPDHVVPVYARHLFHGPVPGDDQTSFIHSKCGIRQEINDIGKALF